MEHPTVLILICLVVVSGFLFIFLSGVFLRNPAHFVECAFPADTPKRADLLSKEKGVGDRLVIYYGARLLFGCILGLAGLWLLARVGVLGH